MEIKRWPDVEAEIQRVIDMHQTHWLAEIPDLHNETLVFLARHVRTARSELFGRLLQEISKRVMRQATNSIYGLREAAREFIVLQVEITIIRLVLTDKPSRRSNYLEIAFAKAVNQLTVDFIRIYKRSAMGRRDELVTSQSEHDEGDAGQSQSGIESIADDRPGPQSEFLKKEDKTVLQKSVQKAFRSMHSHVAHVHSITHQ